MVLLHPARLLIFGNFPDNFIFLVLIFEKFQPAWPYYIQHFYQFWEFFQPAWLLHPALLLDSLEYHSHRKFNFTNPIEREFVDGPDITKFWKSSLIWQILELHLQTLTSQAPERWKDNILAFSRVKFRIWWPVVFEPVELGKSYMPIFRAL